MEFIRGLHNLKPKYCDCVLTIGNFDGIHLGHHAVLSALIKKAKQLQLPSSVMLFEPQPLELFKQEQAPARLSPLRDKLELLTSIGIDRIIAIRFDKKFAAMTAEDFIKEIIVARLGVKYLIIGDDFRFGRGRLGNFAMLQEASKQHHFVVEDTRSLCLDSVRISSTAIRQALSETNLPLAAQFLGRWFSFCGKVQHGMKQGREWGFPTANVHLTQKVLPLGGVFVVRAQTSYGLFRGVANIGTRPTINGIKTLLEVHLFNFQQDLYGQRIEIFLLHKLRDEQKFGSIDLLKQQINQDMQEAKAWLGINS